MSDRTVGFAIHWANWNWALRFLRLMALGIAGVIILLWFVVRMEQINSYRGIETTRATELSATPYLGASYKARTMSKEILPRVRLAAQAAVLQEGRQIARTASLRISVADFSVARESLDRIVSASGGFVTTLNISYPRDSARSLAAQLAIPSAQRETALEELRKLGRVEEETQGSEEVAVQSEDLDIRLKNARDEEGRLANILRIGTGKVSDVLEVENEQTRVRGEIEGMEAEERRLTSRVAFTSIDLSVTEEYQAHLGIRSSPARLQMRNALTEGMPDAADGLLSVVVFLLSSGPSLLLCGVILFWPVRWAWRRWRSSKIPTVAST